MLGGVSCLFKQRYTLKSHVGFVGGEVKSYFDFWSEVKIEVELD